jgi:hypothetical protein
MVFPLIHKKRWFLSPATPNPTRTLPPLKPFTPNHKPGTLPDYFRRLHPEKKPFFEPEAIITV